MSGGSIVSTVGRDAIVAYIQEKLSYFKFGEGGFTLSGVLEEIIDASASGTENVYDYTVSGGDFSVIGVETQETGTHDGPSGNADLVDSGAAWTVNQFIDDLVSNITDGSSATVSSNTATDVVGALSGGTEDDWDAADQYSIAVNKFEIAGLNASYFSVGSIIKIEGSTGNDGFYTIAAVVESGGNTFIKVEEDISTTTPDGILYVDHLPIAFGPSSDLYHYPLVVEERTPGDVLVQSVTDTTGVGDLTGDGIGTINYKDGDLHVEFTANVQTGNVVKMVFKIRNAKKDPSVGAAYETLEADDPTISPNAPDGNPELFSYKKDFASGDIVFRGVGYGTIRCTMRLNTGEAMDDGRGATYGGIPFYFEAGLFDEDDVMIGYATFDKERKTGSVIVTHTVDFVV